MGGATTVAAPARAQQAEPAVIEGYVVAVEQDAIIVDVAGKSGARQGDVVELWRPLVLRHPVTRQPVRDRYPIGAVKLSHVGETLSRVVDMTTLEREAAPGDVVILRRAPAPPAPAAPVGLPAPTPPAGGEA
ncbi:MAG: hypothetical protein JRI23_05440, partial [Deltaproteobacteria bacterium]|nr:hypothetical protein [Deltaproteobacteria bacterium]MBW2530996.1 hypothetical protein [Deltaproteobacteria bacterium]